MNDELKIVKNHANRNAWRMDCLYCAMMDIKNEVLVQTYYYEFILEQYNFYTEKLMHYTCNGRYGGFSYFGTHKISLKMAVA